MNDNKILIKSSKPIATLLTEIETAIVNAGGNFSGDNKKGQFSGKTILGQIKGEYNVNEQGITIHITKKPYLVPMSKITTEIQSYFKI